MVVSDLTAAVADAKQKAGRKNMMFGALWCIGGIAVTAATYQAAASSASGVRGLAQSATAG
jgi:hypothetical protein